MQNRLTNYNFLMHHRGKLKLVGKHVFYMWCELYFTTRQWRAQRKRVIEKQGDICFDCSEKIVDIHHLTYKNLGEEKDGELIGLCRDCHKSKHGRGTISVMADVLKEVL